MVGSQFSWLEGGNFATTNDSIANKSGFPQCPKTPVCLGMSVEETQVSMRNHSMALSLDYFHTTSLGLKVKVKFCWSTSPISCLHKTPHQHYSRVLKRVCPKKGIASNFPISNSDYGFPTFLSSIKFGKTTSIKWILHIHYTQYPILSLSIMSYGFIPLYESSN